MSYTVIYDKICLKVAEDQYIPMILSGDSNVYVSSPFSKRDKRARKWTFFHFPSSEDKRKIVFTKEELLKFAGENYVTAYGEEVFMENNKFVKQFEFPAWMERFIKRAKTLDELVENNTYLTLNVIFQNEFGEAIYSATANNSVNLLEITKEYEDYFSPTEKNMTIVRFSGCGDSPLKKGSKSSFTGQVAGRYKGKKPSWIKEYEKNVRVTRTNNPEEAILFDSEEDMWNKIGDSFKYTITPVSEQSLKNNMIERNYVIRVDCSGYFSKLSSKSLFYTPYEEKAKRFTEKEAQKKIEEIKNKGYKALLKVVCISAKEGE